MVPVKGVILCCYIDIELSIYRRSYNVLLLFVTKFAYEEKAISLQMLKALLSGLLEPAHIECSWKVQ